MTTQLCVVTRLQYPLATLSTKHLGACFLAFGWSLGRLFGVYLEVFFVVQRCFLKAFYLFGEAFLEFFERASVVVALCTSHTHLGYFAPQLNVLTTSWVSRMCRSAIPFTWATSHASISVSVVMLLTGVSSHCGPLEVNRCKPP